MNRYRTRGLHPGCMHWDTGSVRRHELPGEIEIRDLLTRREGPNDFRRHDNQQFRVCLLQVLRAEQSSEERDVAQTWNLAQLLSDAVVQQASDGKGLSGFQDRKSTRLNSSHLGISYAVFC